MNPPELHQIFTTVKAHLLTQRNQSVSSYGTCLYFDAATGRKCAVGCLIPPSLYDPIMEERVGLPDSRPVQEALEAAGVIPKDCWGLAVPFLLRMQRLHDTFPPHEWAEALDTMERELFPTLKDTQ